MNLSLGAPRTDKDIMDYMIDQGIQFLNELIWASIGLGIFRFLIFNPDHWRRCKRILALNDIMKNISWPMRRFLFWISISI